METLSSIIKHLPEFVTAINAVLLAVTGLCLLIPGDQPEKTLKVITDIIAKFSKK